VLYKVASSIILLGLTFASCRLEQYRLESAKRDVLRIRASIAKQEFSEIYDQASSSFRSAASREQFISVLKEHYLELGDPSRFLESRHSVNVSNKGTLFVLEYENVSSGNIERDEFVFVVENDRLMLYNYRFELRN